MWLFIAFLSPMFYAIANISDSFLTNKNFRNPRTLIFYASLFNIPFILGLFLFFGFSLPKSSLLLVFLLLGIINILFLYPYYRGLQSDDTSIVTSFFALGRIFIPIWAFFIIGERLTFGEYFGIILIIFGSALLSVKGSLKDIKFSKAVLYILLASFIISFEGVLLKYLFEQGVSVATGIGGQMTTSFLFTLFFLLHKETRKDIKENFSIFKKRIPLFFFEESSSFIAFMCETYALSIASLSLVKGITILTPLFILIYAKLLGKKLPHLFNEQRGVGITLKKVILFSLIALGVFLIAQ